MCPSWLSPWSNDPWLEQKKAPERCIGGGGIVGWFTIPKTIMAAPENGCTGGRLVSFWDGIFSGTMLVSGRVSFAVTQGFGSRDSNTKNGARQGAQSKGSQGQDHRNTTQHATKARKAATTHQSKHEKGQRTDTEAKTHRQKARDHESKEPKRQHHTTGKQLPLHKTGPSGPVRPLIRESRLVCTWLGSVSLLCFASFLRLFLCSSSSLALFLCCALLGPASFSCLLCSFLCASALLSSVLFFRSALLPLPFFSALLPRMSFVGVLFWSFVRSVGVRHLRLVDALAAPHWWMRGRSQPINSEIRLHLVPLFGLGSRPPEGDGLVNL